MKAQPLDIEINAIENNLLGGIQIKGDPFKTYNVLDRMKYYNVPGFSVAVIKDGKLHWAKTYGVLDANNKSELNENTLFQAASISKPISALGILKLVENGRLDLDTDVNQYLKSWKIEENKFTKNEKVTIRRLLTHTSGIDDNGFDGYTQSEQIPTTTQVLNGEGNTSKVVVSNVPGSERRYSGGGYVILQQVIEDLSGVSFEIYMEKEILRPLGMTSSTYQQPLNRAVYKNVSSAHTNEGQVINGGWHNYPEKAPGGLWTTPSDYAKYCIAVQNIYAGKANGLLSKETIGKMLSKHMDDWGLGPIVKGEKESLRITHDGSNKGFKADFTAFVNRGDAVIVMSNGDNGGVLGNEFVRGVSAFYNWGIRVPRIIDSPKLSANELEKFVGVYAWSERPAYRVEVVLNDAQLVYVAPGDYSTKRFMLTPFGTLDFIDLESETEIKFRTDKDGEIEGLLSRGRFVFNKISPGE